ncbi:MAG TPA: PRC-barrel domain-containing protein [Stellaceae bacterium]|nr:PRC-barrel domain-containing protein [Stellaceae bacterium]
MPKTIAIAAGLSLGLLLASPLVLAQDFGAVHPHSGQPAHLLTIALTTQSGGLRASQLIGSTVYDVQNRNIGSVKDIVLDRDGKVGAVIVDVGAFLGVGGKYVAVTLDDLKTDHDRLTLSRSKEQLQAAQSYQLDNRR